MDNTKKISIDMNEVAIMSSSFADELFGKLVKEIGFMRFNQNFTITNVSSTNSNLIERAISQRMSYKE
jgi:anti-anti-sigma regulatory factor